MDRIYRVTPAFDGGDDFVRVCGPTKWFGLTGIVLSDEALDGGLQVNAGVEDVAFEVLFRAEVRRRSACQAFDVARFVGVRFARRITVTQNQAISKRWNDCLCDLN